MKNLIDPSKSLAKRCRLDGHRSTGKEVIQIGTDRNPDTGSDQANKLIIHGKALRGKPQESLEGTFWS